MASAITRQNDDLPKEDPETIFARANLALARSQRLVASWLPSPTADELANEPSEEELQKQEEDIFVAVPEKYVVYIRAPHPIHPVLLRILGILFLFIIISSIFIFYFRYDTSIVFH